jgi:hypothetical protein
LDVSLHPGGAQGAEVELPRFVVLRWDVVAAYFRFVGLWEDVVLSRPLLAELKKWPLW